MIGIIFQTRGILVKHILTEPNYTTFIIPLVIPEMRTQRRLNDIRMYWKAQRAKQLKDENYCRCDKKIKHKKTAYGRHLVS